MLTTILLATTITLGASATATATPSLATPVLVQSGPSNPAATLRGLMIGPRSVLDALLGAGFDAYEITSSEHPTGPGEIAIDVFGTSAEFAAIRAQFPQHPLLVVDSGRPLRERLANSSAGPDMPDARYHDVGEIETDLLAFETNYPSLARRVDLTTTYGGPRTHGGRVIYGLKISDNPGVEEDEPAILVVANHHSRELNTIEVALDVARRLLTGYGSDPRITALVDDKEIWVVPTMNPDGLDHVWNVNDFWRKNRRNNGGGSYGVDLNRNYPFFWSRCGSSTNPGSETYHGPSAGSEPETQVMMRFSRAERFERVFDQHSYGRDLRWSHNPLTVNRIPGPVASLLDGWQASIANAMGYRINSSCCCGGHQHWQFAEHGAPSYLGEMGTGFQPEWSSTVSEVARVWPGIDNFLFRPTPLQGHVTSLAGGAPVECEIRLPAAPFLDGQKRRSEARFGRYAVWLSPGNYTLEFVAAGYETQQVQVTIASGTTTLRDVVMVPTLRPTVLSSTGSPCPGCPVPLSLSSPDDPGAGYFIGVSPATNPSIQVGPRTIPIAASGLIEAVFLSPTVFTNFFGTLDGSGSTNASLNLPPGVTLSGVTLHFAAITSDAAWPGGVKGISNRVSVTLN